MKKMVKISMVLSAIVCMFCVSGCNGTTDSQKSEQPITERNAISEVSEISQVSEISEISEVSEVSVISENSERSESWEIEESSEISQTGEDSEFVLGVQAESLEEFFELPQMQAAMSEIEEKMSNDTQTTRVFVEDYWTVVAEITLQKQVQGAELEQTLAYVEQLTDENQEIFVTFIDNVERVSNLSNLFIQVRYSNADGSTIYQKMFSSNMKEDSNDVP